jgi:Fanconi anemia group M protein
MTFFNIFSMKNKAKEKQKHQIKIIADHREKNALVASELIKQGFEIEFQQLAVADYLVNDIALERKTITDFKSSIINKRIMQQLPELKQHKKYALILEGFNTHSYEGIIHENAFRGFLLTILFNYQVPIIYTHDEADTAKYIALLTKKSEKSDIALRPAKIVLSKEERLQFILEGFPGVGPVTAKKLLAEYKTLKTILQTNEQDLKKLIGTKAKPLIELLNHAYKSKKQ